MHRIHQRLRGGHATFLALALTAALGGCGDDPLRPTAMQPAGVGPALSVGAGSAPPERAARGDHTRAR